MKRFLICILVFGLILPFAAANADSNPMRSLRLETSTEGDELDVRFYAEMEYPNATTAFESMDFVLTYANDVLELIGLQKDGDAPESDIIDDSFVLQVEKTDQPGRYEFHCASALGNAGSGLLLHLRFRILKEGGYGFRLHREGYSTYDTAADQSQSYLFALLQASEPVTDTTPLPEPERSESGNELAQETSEKGWFARLLESIFGSSCTGGK